MKSDESLKKDQYIEEIEQTREEIDRTLLLLQGKLSPRELWDQALRSSGGARELSLNLGRTLRDNPIPATLLGISLIWLIVAGMSDNRPRPKPFERERINVHMQQVDPRLVM